MTAFFKFQDALHKLKNVFLIENSVLIVFKIIIGVHNPLHNRFGKTLKRNKIIYL